MVISITGQLEQLLTIDASCGFWPWSWQRVGVNGLWRCSRWCPIHRSLHSIWSSRNFGTCVECHYWVSNTV